jgi:hypothetical protein
MADWDASLPPQGRHAKKSFALLLTINHQMVMVLIVRPANANPTLGAVPSRRAGRSLSG